MTSNLKERIRRHIENKYPGSFTSRYNINKLVYFEVYDNISEAISREKQIKAGSRQKKIDLINSKNAEWVDLIESLED